MSLLQDAACGLLYPILPIFLTVTLGAPLALVGVVEGLAEGAASITKLTSGFVSDRFNKRAPKAPTPGAGPPHKTAPFVIAQALAGIGLQFG